MYGRRLLLMVVASLALHGAFVLLAPHHAPPAPPHRRTPPPPVPVAIVRQQAKAIEDQQKEPPKPPEAKPEPPKPPPPKPRPEAPKPPPKPETPPPPRPEAPPEPPKPAAPPKPAPLILSNVALNGGVAVQTGAESNLFGDPSRDAKGFVKGTDAPRVAGEGTGTGPAAPRKVVVKPPTVLAAATGTYPEEMRDQARVVHVELLLSIDASGAVVDAVVRKGDLPAFDAEAKRTARRLRFKPATRDGVPIPYQMSWTITFLPSG